MLNMKNPIGLTEAAALFGVHPATVRRWTKKPELGFPQPLKRPDGHLQFDRQAVERYREQTAQREAAA